MAVLTIAMIIMMLFSVLLLIMAGPGIIVMVRACGFLLQVMNVTRRWNCFRKGSEEGQISCL